MHQRRKGPAEEPYINHLLEVAMLVAEATGGTDTNLVIAALLHDAIEDCEVPRELITETFGEDVVQLSKKSRMTKAFQSRRARRNGSKPLPRRVKEPSY